MAKEKRLQCVTAVANEPFCECLEQNLPVINFVDYVQIVTRTKEELKYNTFSGEEKAVVDKTRTVRDQCVRDVATMRPARETVKLPPTGRGRGSIFDPQSASRRRTRITCTALHALPSVVLMPRSLSTLATPRCERSDSSSNVERNASARSSASAFDVEPSCR